MIPLNRLMLGGLGGLIACAGMSAAFRWKVSNQIKQTKACQEALDLLKQHKGARYLLGEPIKDFRANFSSLGEFFGYQTEVTVSVAGPKTPGLLFFTLLGEDEPKVLDTVQLQIGKDNNRRLVIKKSVQEEKSSS